MSIMTGTYRTNNNSNQSNLSYSELRILKNKRRRQRIVRRQYILLLTVITMFISTLVFWGTTLSTGAQSDDYRTDFKYYKSVTVHSGDTLTDIADKYYSDDHYKSLESFMSEICSINRLDSQDSIKAGENLIVPYFSAEFKN